MQYQNLDQCSKCMIFSLRKVYSFILLAAMVALMSAVVACGGGGSVDESPEKNQLYSWWDGYDQKADVTVDNVTLGNWIANGFVTENGKPVIVIDISSNFGVAKTIPGSYQGTAIGYVNADTRDEGPVNSSAAVGNTASQNVISGATVDAMLKGTGATSESVIVFANGAGINTNLTRVWWAFYYWGFSQANIKILMARLLMFLAQKLA